MARPKVQAKMRMPVKRILKEYDNQPDMKIKALKTVVE